MSLRDRRQQRAADQAATDGAAQAEVDRLVALEPEDLAVELMPGFGPDGAKSRGSLGIGPLQVIDWLMTPYGRGVSTKPLVPSVIAGLQALEHAGLVQERTSGVGTGAPFYSLTSRGETTLADGSAESFIRR